MKNRILTDEEVECLLANAERGPDPADEIEPRAVTAWYDAERGLVMFELKNGCLFGFPPTGDGYPLLNHATPEQLAQVEVEGEALHWEELDGDVTVPGLLLHLLNVKVWYAKWVYGADSVAARRSAPCDPWEFGGSIEPWPEKAWYDPKRQLVMFEIRNGCVFGFPPPETTYWGLAGATPAQLAQVEPYGEALHWEEIDADIAVPGLLLHLLNVEEWYSKWFGAGDSGAKAAVADQQ